MNRAEYNDILKNVMNILKNPNGNFGKRFLTGDPEKDAEILKSCEREAAVALIAVDEFYSYLTKAAHEGGVLPESRG